MATPNVKFTGVIIFRPSGRKGDRAGCSARFLVGSLYSRGALLIGPLSAAVTGTALSGSAAAGAFHTARQKLARGP